MQGTHSLAEKVSYSTVIIVTLNYYLCFDGVIKDRLNLYKLFKVNLYTLGSFLSIKKLNLFILFKIL
jgi:hypothetical protein